MKSLSRCSTFAQRLALECFCFLITAVACVNDCSLALAQPSPDGGGRRGGRGGRGASEPQTTVEELAKLPVVTATNVAALLKEVKFPEEFHVTIFATPPAVNYPTYVAAAPDGTLYVSSDGNGSLDRGLNRGRVLRVRDKNGDGQADEVKAFVPDVDSPRGLIWDHDRVYLLHPPDISAFIDRDGDGVADEKKTLVKGIGWTFKDRPADHASNGLELGIDGWIYAAIGDFGFMEATGTDGRKLQLRGGGVVRVRPDGTGLELWATGTRNILEVAVSPLLDGFARDNTNDGGRWDVRLHHFSGMTEHGYPRLFLNFPDEIIKPLADYGGGSGCGGAWIDEPGIPTKWNNAPFTADWGTSWIYHHGLTPNGATFTATQEQFMSLPRVTDLDVDANSAIYAASWRGGQFTWAGRNIGFIVRATPKGYQPEPLPDFEKLSAAELVKQLESPSHRRRLEAQRTLLRPGNPARRTISLLERLAADKTKPLPSRVAAIFTLKQLLGAATHSTFARLARDPSVAAWAIRALGDSTEETRTMPVSAVVAGLKSTDARVRKESVITLSRAGATKYSANVAQLLADPDPVVAHTSVQALIRLQTSDACFTQLDSREASKDQRAGALRVLQGIHDPRVVEGMIARLNRETDAARRAGLLIALCRLYSQEGVWKGDSWGTRPDTRGPYYQPEPWSETPKIASVLDAAIEKADAKEAVMIVREIERHRVSTAGKAVNKLIALAGAEPSLVPMVVTQLAESDEVPRAAIPILAKAATDAGTTNSIRTRAIVALAKTDSPEAWNALLPALQKLQGERGAGNRGGRGGRGGFGGRGGGGGRGGQSVGDPAREAVLSSPQLKKFYPVIVDQAAKNDGEASQFADTLLLTLAARSIGDSEVRTAVARALDTGWADPKRRVQIINAAVTARDTSRASQIVASLDDTDSAVSQAARNAVQQLAIDADAVRAEAKLPRVGAMSVAEVLEAVVNTKGEVQRGSQVFTELSCNACHTVRANEPLKGPFLGTIATIYRRRELAEAILLPNKSLAQGFIANHFELKDGTETDGFVVREAADAVTIRTITAVEQKIPVAQIVKREKREQSLMPEGLAANLTVRDLASLVDYLESLSQQP